MDFVSPASAQAKADAREIERYVRQSPRNFGIGRTHWTLTTLVQVVPSLRGFSPYGAQKALARAGFGYKRGQPHVHSPDPQYEVKKGLWTRQRVTHSHPWCDDFRHFRRQVCAELNRLAAGSPEFLRYVGLSI